MKHPEWPIFVFLDDTSLELCESLEVARREYEGIDVESGSFSFFDFSGCPLKPVFLIPNRHSKFLGLIRSCSSGVFEFERDPSSELHHIDAALDNAEYLTKNDRFATLDEVCGHLEKRGLPMERYLCNRRSIQPKAGLRGNAEQAL